MCGSDKIHIRILLVLVLLTVHTQNAIIIMNCLHITKCDTFTALLYRERCGIRGVHCQYELQHLPGPVS